MATNRRAPDPKVGYETWTPANAENALSKNEINRNIRRSRVEQYQRDMENGDWNPHSAPIVFDSTGKLIDGQHRLTAQVNANITIRWMVVREVPPETQTVMDTGAGRSVADLLSFGGEKKAGLLVAVTRLVHLVIEKGMQGSRYSQSASEVLRTLEEHPEIRVSVDICDWFNRTRMVMITPSVIGCAHWMISQVNGREEADAFIHRIGTLTNEKEGSPVLALARRVNEIKRNQQRVHGRDMLNLVIKAWNYDAEGKRVGKLSLYSKTGEYKLLEVKKRLVPLEEPEDHTEDQQDEVTEESA